MVAKQTDTINNVVHKKNRLVRFAIFSETLPEWEIAYIAQRHFQNGKIFILLMLVQ